MATLLLATLAIGTPTAAAPDERGAAPSAERAGDIEVHTLRVGPVSLNPVGTGGDHVARSTLIPRPPGDFVLKSFIADLVYEDGTPVPRDDVHLHHIAIAKLNVEDPACPGRHAPGFPNLPLWVILASGAERTPIELFDPFGYFEPAAGGWGANYHLVNASASAQEVYIQYEVGLIPGIDHPDIIPVTPYFMDVEGSCGNAEYTVPGGGGPGSTHTRTAEFVMPEAGTVLGSGGHLHSGGIATELYNEAGKLLCRSVPTDGDDHNHDDHHNHSYELRSSHDHQHGPGVEGMSTCPFIMEPVAQGETLELRSIYSNERRIAGAMGINITMIAHNWFPPPASSPLQLPPLEETTTVPPSTTTVEDTMPPTSVVPQSAQPIAASPRYTG